MKIGPKHIIRLIVPMIFVILFLSLVSGGDLVNNEFLINEILITGALTNDVLTKGALVNGVLTNNESINNTLTNDTINVTKEIALEAIEKAKEIIIEMQENNFSIIYMNDTLLEAERELERAKYAEILRNDNASVIEITEAEKYLQLFDWEKITYKGVLFYTDKIEEREKEAFIIFDSIAATKIKLKAYQKDNVDVQEAEKFLEAANIAFYEDRYVDAHNLVGAVRDDLEIKKAQLATLNVLKRSTQNFIQKNWIQILIFLFIIIIIGIFSYLKIKRKLIKKKIKKMKVEKQVLLSLMKKAQLERFKKKNISGMVYNIRKDKYLKRINEIKEVLPVYEEKIHKRKKNLKNIKKT